MDGNKVDIQSEILIPGFSGRKLGQVPCEDVAVRFPIPECWIYMFRVEKHFRYGSVKSAHRRYVYLFHSKNMFSIIPMKKNNRLTR